MRELLDSASGERMSLDEYRADFQRHFWHIGDAGFWKLERQQTFAEPGNESWKSFAAGRWEEAMQRLESDRPAIEDYYRKIGERGFRTRRLRVVSEPLTPYLRWELRLLLLRHEFGAGVRVIGADRVQRFERTAPLPEMCTLGTEVMYEVVYDDGGALAGGVRYRDGELIAQCREFIRDLYEPAEELDVFADRAGLLPEPR